MRILYDVSRLLSRAERSAPTGVDRVCLAYAEWLASHPDVVMIPVRGRKGRLVTVNQAWFRDFVRALRARWDGRTTNGAARHEARLLAALTHDHRPAESVMCPPPEPATKPAKDKSRVLRQFFRSPIRRRFQSLTSTSTWATPRSMTRPRFRILNRPASTGW